MLTAKLELLDPPVEFVEELDVTLGNPENVGNPDSTARFQL